MQVPWTGYPLRALLDRVEPLGSARFVRFVSIEDKENLPGQRDEPWYPWPYFEGLRLDEARHDLAFVVLGSYGHALPMQHGAPVRLAIPWKYGYKGPKSLVRIELVAEQPETFWNQLQPREYGFYSNVDPGKPHPRWSQAEETDIGTGEKRPTLLYNGYDQVAALYDGKEDDQHGEDGQPKTEALDRQRREDACGKDHGRARRLLPADLLDWRTRPREKNDRSEAAESDRQRQRPITRPRRGKRADREPRRLPRHRAGERDQRRSGQPVASQPADASPVH